MVKFWKPKHMINISGWVPTPTKLFDNCDCVADEITVHTLEAVDEHTVKLIFSVPPVLVGLHGRVELRYTSDKQYVLTSWPIFNRLRLNDVPRFNSMHCFCFLLFAHINEFLSQNLLVERSDE
jgi:hypothetical protein